MNALYFPGSRLLRYVAGAAVATLALLTAGCATAPAPHEGPALAPNIRANGIARTAADGALYIVDDTTSRVMASHDGAPFEAAASLPTAPGMPSSWSALAAAPDGTLFVQRFGFGRDGAIFVLAPGHGARALSGVDPQRRRLGLVWLGDGRLLSTWVERSHAGTAIGGVSLIRYSLDPSSRDTDQRYGTGVVGERDLHITLGKPVGIVVEGDTVFVSDQLNDTIVAFLLTPYSSVATPTTPTVVAHVVKPDLMTADDQGNFYTKCNAGDLCRVTAKGQVVVIGTGFHDVRGLAIDATHRQLYVVDRAALGQSGHIRALPLR